MSTLANAGPQTTRRASVCAAVSRTVPTGSSVGDAPLSAVPACTLLRRVPGGYDGESALYNGDWHTAMEDYTHTRTLEKYRALLRVESPFSVDYQPDSDGRLSVTCVID